MVVTLYSTRGCHRCESVERILENENVSFEKVYIDNDDDARLELSMSNIFSVPAMKLGSGRMVALREFSDGVHSIDEEKLKAILGV